jgi:drug/metabolite transporter (DMT)-like permease
MSRKKNKNLIAIFYMLSCCFFYSLMYCAAKYIVNKDISPVILVFYRNFFAAIILLPFLYKRANVFSSFNKLNFLRGFFGFSSMVLYFYALNGLGVNKSVAISFISPIFTCLLAVIFFKDYLDLYKSAGLLIGFFGCMTILRPDFHSLGFFEFCALGSCFVWSLSNIIIKKLTKDQDSEMISFYSFIMISILSLPWVLYYGYLPGFSDLIILLIVALTSVFAQFFLAKSFSLGDISFLMPFDFTRLVFSSIFSYLLFADTLTASTIFGAALIILANFIVAKSKKS